MGRLSRSTCALVVALATATLLAGTAQAAGGFTANTRLRIHAPDRVERGKRFHIRGKILSRKDFCTDRVRVILIRKDRGVIDSDRTNNKGEYVFHRRINTKAVFHTRFVGRIGGVHPNIKVCLASRSDRVTVRVA